MPPHLPHATLLLVFLFLFTALAFALGTLERRKDQSTAAHTGTKRGNHGELSASGLLTLPKDQETAVISCVV